VFFVVGEARSCPFDEKCQNVADSADLRQLSASACGQRREERSERGEERQRRRRRPERRREREGGPTPRGPPCDSPRVNDA